MRILANVSTIYISILLLNLENYFLPQMRDLQNFYIFFNNIFIFIIFSKLLYIIFIARRKTTNLNHA